jgi:hypothetical protein
MTVDELQQTTGSIAELAPSSVRLVHGETPCTLETFLATMLCLLAPTDYT